MRYVFPLVAFCLALAPNGCGTISLQPPAREGPFAGPPQPLAVGTDAEQHNQSNRTSAALPAESQPVAYVDGKPVSWRDLNPSLVEYAGGRILAELALDRQITSRLAERGLTVTAEQTDAERVLMRAALHDDPNDAERLLSRLCLRRGLGPVRFGRLLERNAALRLLVQDQVQVTDAALQQAHALRYGPRYETRLIVVDSLAPAAKLVREANAGRSFVELVMEQSTDASRANGGMIGPVSLADPAYPKAIRQTLEKLKPGDVSQPVALERGFAVLKLESKSEAQQVPFDDVKNTLTDQVRRQAERLLMDRLARTLLDEVKLVVRDPALRTSWDQYKDATGR